MWSVTVGWLRSSGFASRNNHNTKEHGKQPFAVTTQFYKGVTRLLSAIVAFLKGILTTPGNIIPTTIDLGRQDNRGMIGDYDRPRSDPSWIMEAVPTTHEEQTETVLCVNNIVGEGQNSLVAAPTASRTSKPGKSKNQAVEARAFVSEALCVGPVPAAKINQAAADAGFTPCQLRHAAATLAIVRTKLPGMRTGWLWALPGATVTSEPDAPTSSDTYSEVGVA